MNSSEFQKVQHSLLATRLKLSAKLNLQLATALIGNGQDELRRHFAEAAGLMVEAANALELSA